MAGLGETVAELLARNQTGPVDAGVRLSSVSGFGHNPGALRMGLHLPKGLPGNSPLVVVLHGCGQTAAGYAAGAGWLELADRHGFAVLCPEQVRANNGNLCFNWFEDGDTRRSSGEAASIAQMVRHAVAEHDLDAGRVFVTGLSAGGAMAAVMLAAYPELFAAGAVIAGLPYGAASGMSQAMGAMRQVPALSAEAWGDKVRAAAPAPARWPRIAVWHGDADATVAPAAADALVLQWCDVHDVSEPAAVETGSARHRHMAWRRSDGGVAVELHRISGLGHGTPIAADGSQGCGKPGPWILEAGLSSSQEIARSWGVDRAWSAKPVVRPSPSPRVGGVRAASAPAPVAAFDVGGTITRALRGAGLLR